MRYTCDNCSNPVLVKELSETPDLAERLDPGNVVPAGECQCGALIYISAGLLTSPEFMS